MKNQPTIERHFIDYPMNGTNETKRFSYSIVENFDNGIISYTYIFDDTRILPWTNAYSESQAVILIKIEQGIR
jgi:hypothetical protein